MKTTTLFPVISLFLFTACMQEQTPRIKQETKANFQELQNEIKHLDIYQKAKLYQLLQKEINILKEKGDKAYQKEYYYDALQYYTLLNQYTSKEFISQSQLKEIEKIANIKAKEHYQQAIKFLKKNKRRALQEFNYTMMNNPRYKDTKKLYNELLNERDMKIYLNELESSLEEQIVNYKGTYKEFQSIHKIAKLLQSYNYKNSSLKYAKEFLENNASKYIDRLHKEEQKYQYLKQLYQYYKTNDFKKSRIYANKVLQIEDTNKEAKNILIQIQEKEKKAVLEYINRGKEAYKNKQLEKALNYFKKALDIDKKNKNALIYYKKIQRQLQTIKSLQ